MAVKLYGPRIERTIKLALEFLIKEEIGWLPVNSIKLAEKYTTSIQTLTEVSMDHELDINKILNGRDADLFYWNGQYKIIYDEYIRSEQRLNWTIMHELAHIYLGHLEEFEPTMLSRGLGNVEYKAIEREADIFTAEVLAPRIVLNKMNIRFYRYIQRLCKLSEPAAMIRAKEITNKSRLAVYNEYEEEILKCFSRYTEVVNPHPTNIVSMMNPRYRGPR